jgi:uncharacterized protein YwgA
MYWLVADLMEFARALRLAGNCFVARRVMQRVDADELTVQEAILWLRGRPSVNQLPRVRNASPVRMDVPPTPWKRMITDRQKLMLSALATAERGALSPVQVQKLFFLIDKKLSGSLGGQLFKFEPYDYGPFDANVYVELEALKQQGLVEIDGSSAQPQRRYSLTEEGQAIGAELLGQQDQQVRESFKLLCDFVRKLGFRELVSAIYKSYPDMKVNSVFREA